MHKKLQRDWAVYLHIHATALGILVVNMH